MVCRGDAYEYIQKSSVSCWHSKQSVAPEKVFSGSSWDFSIAPFAEKSNGKREKYKSRDLLSRFRHDPAKGGFMNQTMNSFSCGTVEDSFQAFLVEGAYFTETEEYPIIRPNMISDCIPSNIMPFQKAITYHGDLSNTFICTFSPDKTFERVRRNPKRYVPFFRRTAGLIGFDYSIHTDMPIIKQKAQINDNLSLTYFFGNNGIPVIPNLRCGVDELLPEFFDAIPKGKMVAIGTHGFCKETQEKCEWYCFLEKVIGVLAPPSIIVYGSLNGKMFDSLKAHTNFVFFDPWITQRRKEAKKHVN